MTASVQWMEPKSGATSGGVLLCYTSSLQDAIAHTMVRVQQPVGVAMLAEVLGFYCAEEVS